MAMARCDVWRTPFFVRNKEPAVLSTIEIMLHSLLLSCLLASTSALLCPAPPKTTSRRALLAGTLAVAAAGPAPALAISTIATAADVVQVVQSYQTLGLSLEQWSVETALMQIGRPTQLQRAVDQLPEDTLKRLGKEMGLGDTVAVLKKARQSTLTLLYLASGATKYESQEVGLKYMGDVKAQVKVEREQLVQLGKLIGIDVASPSS